MADRCAELIMGSSFDDARCIHHKGHEGSHVCVVVWPKPLCEECGK